ncbi:hypothetical protein EMPG_17533 [Blastomyces silverae]|uniref:Fucose-specific lectin n=1 Tax=Blastomyces silverae TaxID=2060906 RepID=A0A0H1BCM4_9EURO|nr:hypothetical protein EMPG_17533 [Blastomyces silverae]
MEGKIPTAHTPGFGVQLQDDQPSHHPTESESGLRSECVENLQTDASIAYPGLEVDLRRAPSPHEKQGLVNQLPEVVVPTAAGWQERRRWRRRWIIIGCILAFIVTAAVVLVPVGVLVIGKEESPQEPVGADQPSAPPGSPPNKDSVLRGTRLASMDAQNGGDVFLYYQNGDASLRYITLSEGRVWQGSTTLPLDDAMLHTPIESTQTDSNGTVTWWLFYVDKSNVIQNIYSRRNPTGWQRGNIGSKGYTVPAQSSIAFTALRGRKYDSEIHGFVGGLTLFTTDADGRVHEYIYNDEDESWSDGFTFPNTNGHGGASLWSRGSYAYLHTLSDTQMLDIWWRDYDSQSADRNGWQLGTSSHAAVTPNASMCGAFAFAYQGANGWIQGSNFTARSPAMVRWDTMYDIVGGGGDEVGDTAAVPAMDGTALSCWHYYPRGQEKRTMFQVFYQSERGEVRDAKRYWEADNATVPGTWHYSKVPIR